MTTILMPSNYNWAIIASELKAKLKVLAELTKRDGDGEDEDEEKKHAGTRDSHERGYSAFELIRTVVRLKGDEELGVRPRLGGTHS